MTEFDHVHIAMNATNADLQSIIDALRNELAAAKLDARTAYARGLKDAAQAFEVRRVEIVAHADAELAKLGVKQG